MARHRASARPSKLYTQFSLCNADDDRSLLGAVDTTVVGMAALLKESPRLLGEPQPRSIRLLKKKLEDADAIRASLDIRQLVASEPAKSRFITTAEDAFGGLKNPTQKAVGLAGRGMNALADRGLLGSTAVDFEEFADRFSEIAIQSTEAASRIGELSGGQGVLVTHDGLAWLIKPTAATLALGGAAALAPLLMATAPWIGACRIASLNEKNVSLKTLRNTGHCLCRGCEKLLGDMISRSDWDAFKVGLTSTAVLAPMVFLWTVGRKAVNYRRFSERDRVATTLWRSTAGRLRTTCSINRVNRWRDITVSITRIPCPKAMKILRAICGPFEAAAVLAAGEATGIAHLKKLV